MFGLPLVLAPGGRADVLSYACCVISGSTSWSELFVSGLRRLLASPPQTELYRPADPLRWVSNHIHCVAVVHIALVPLSLIHGVDTRCVVLYEQLSVSG